MALSPQTAVRAIVTGDGTVSGLIGARMYAGMAPQDTPYPYIVFGRTKAFRHYYLGGHAGHADTDIQVDCRGIDSDAAEALGEAVRDCLDTYRNTVTVSASSLVIRDTKLLEDVTVFEEPEDASDSPRFARAMVFRIYHQEPAPTP